MRSRSPEADACERMRRMRSRTMLSRYWMLEIRDLRQKVSRRLSLRAEASRGLRRSAEDRVSFQHLLVAGVVIEESLSSREP